MAACLRTLQAAQTVVGARVRIYHSLHGRGLSGKTSLTEKLKSTSYGCCEMLPLGTILRSSRGTMAQFSYVVLKDLMMLLELKAPQYRGKK